MARGWTRMVAFVGCLAAVAVAAPAGPFMPARAAAAAECEPRHLLQIDHRIAVDPDSPSDVITLAEGTDPVVVAPDGGSAAVWKDPGGTGGAPGELSVVGHDGTVHVLGDVILAPSWSGDSTRLVSQALGSNPFERVIATYTPASVGPLATFVREPLTFGSPVLTADGAAVVWVEETTVSGGTLRWAPAHGGEVREVALPGEFAFGLVPSDEPGRVALVSRFAGGAHLRVLDTDAAADPLQTVDTQSADLTSREWLMPEWSPDGAAIAWGSRTPGNAGLLQVIDLVDGSSEFVASATDMEWDPDGSHLAAIEDSVHTGPGVVVWDREASSSVRFSQGSWVWAPEWSPLDDGSLAWTERVGSRSGVKVADLDGGEPLELVEGSDPRWSPDGEWIAYSAPTGGDWPTVDVIHPDGTGAVTVRERGTPDRWIARDLADLEVTLGAAVPPALGRSFQTDVTVTNQGPCPSSGGRVEWGTVEGVTVAAADAAVSIDDGQWWIGPLAPGASRSEQVTFTTPISAPDHKWTLRATARGAGDDPDPTDDSDQTAVVLDPVVRLGGLHPVDPTRIVDTRKGIGAPQALVGPGGTLVVDVSGVAGIPTSGVAGVALNLTGVGPSADTHFTVWPSGSPRPNASQLNLPAGRTAASQVMAATGPNGTFAVRNQSGTVDVLVDITGWFDATPGGGSGIVPIAPTRLLDTRRAVDGAAPITADEILTLTVAEPGQVRAVIVNLTAVGSTAATHVTAWPAALPEPRVSNINVLPGEVRANLALVPVDASGEISLATASGEVHLLADLVAVVLPDSSAGDGFRGTVPARVLDTRRGIGAADAPLGPRSTLTLPLRDIGPVPAGATAVVLSVTAVGATAPTHLTVWPSGEPRPTASNLNVAGSGALPNLVVVPLGDDGAVQVFNNAGNVEIVADVTGWIG